MIYLIKKSIVVAKLQILCHCPCTYGADCIFHRLINKSGLNDAVSFKRYSICGELTDQSLDLKVNINDLKDSPIKIQQLLAEK